MRTVVACASICHVPDSHTSLIAPLDPCGLRRSIPRAYESRLAAAIALALFVGVYRRFVSSIDASVAFAIWCGSLVALPARPRKRWLSVQTLGRASAAYFAASVVALTTELASTRELTPGFAAFAVVFVAASMLFGGILGRWAGAPIFALVSETDEDPGPDARDRALAGISWWLVAMTSLLAIVWKLDHIVHGVTVRDAPVVVASAFGACGVAVANRRRTARAAALRAAEREPLAPLRLRSIGRFDPAVIDALPRIRHSSLDAPRVVVLAGGNDNYRTHDADRPIALAVPWA